MPKNPFTMLPKPKPVKIDPTAKDLSSRITPEMEEVVEEDMNNPYRGIQDHGVKPTHDPSPVQVGWENGANAHIQYENVPHEIAPIPVYMAYSGQRELRTIRVTREYFNNGPRMILPKNERRIKATIKNNSNVYVVIGPDSGISSMTGWPLGPQESIELIAESEIWGATSIDQNNEGFVDILQQVVVTLP